MRNVVEPLRLGFIGAGRIARHHARYVAELAAVNQARLVAVADIIPQAAESLAAVHGATPYQDFRHMLRRETLDAVFILTPPEVRLEPITLAAEQGIAIFCEKPPARSVEQAAEIAEVIERAGVINSVGFMYRWLEVVTRARELLIGHPIACVDSAFLCGVALDPQQPQWTFQQEHAGGPLLEQAIHSFDVLRYLSGEVNSVAAFGCNPILKKTESFTIEDSHAVALRFVSGAAGVHLHSWVHQGVVVQARIFGVELDLTIKFSPPSALWGKVGDVVIDYHPEADDAYRAELRGFIDAVRTHDQTLIKSPYRDAVESLKLTLDAMASISTQQEYVE